MIQLLRYSKIQGLEDSTIEFFSFFESLNY